MVLSACVIMTIRARCDKLHHICRTTLAYDVSFILFQSKMHANVAANCSRRWSTTKQLYAYQFNLDFSAQIKCKRLALIKVIIPIIHAFYTVNYGQ